MATFVYRPDHPFANENGFVNKADIYEYYDKAMLRGNERVKIHVISDTMAETRHMVDNKIYTSKHKFRQTTRAAGCIEVGNEVVTMSKPRKQIEPDRRQRRDDIKKAIYQLRNA